MFKLRVSGLHKGEKKKNPKQNPTPVQVEAEMESTLIYYFFTDSLILLL